MKDWSKTTVLRMLMGTIVLNFICLLAAIVTMDLGWSILSIIYIAVLLFIIELINTGI
jgi:diacylglycerol kinase